MDARRIQTAAARVRRARVTDSQRTTTANSISLKGKFDPLSLEKSLSSRGEGGGVPSPGAHSRDSRASRPGTQARSVRYLPPDPQPVRYHFTGVNRKDEADKKPRVRTAGGLN